MNRTIKEATVKRFYYEPMTALCICDDIALAAFDLLARVKAPWPAAKHALAI